jgi:hypothetical protein
MKAGEAVETQKIINFCGKLSFILSFASASNYYVTYIFTPTCTITIISFEPSLEPSPLNAEFQHFIPRFNKISLLCGHH